MSHIVSHTFGGKVTIHFLKLDGTTVCGRIPQGEGWVTGTPASKARIVCRKCTRGVQVGGISRLFTCCPKCLADTGQQIPLNPDKSCPDCKGRWN